MEHFRQFDPLLFARAYDACAALASDDDSAPEINGVHVELFDKGVRLVATDLYALVTTWVPNLGSPYAEQPALSEAPNASFTMLDRHAVLAQVSKHARRAAGAIITDAKKRKCAVELPPLTMRTGKRATPQETLDGFAGLIVSLTFDTELSGSSDLYEGKYPDWRALALHPDKSAAVGLLFGAELLSRVSAVGAMLGSRMRLDVSAKGGARFVVDPEDLEINDEEIAAKPGGLIFMTVNAVAIAK